MQKVLGCFQERLAYNKKPIENLAGEKVREQLTFENLVPEEKKTPEIIPILPGEFQPRKVEELLPDIDIMPDTYIIYPTGGYHPFYGVPNTFPRYQLPIWPYVKRIKYSNCWKSEENLNTIKRNNLDINQTLSHLNPTFHRGYFMIGLIRISTYIAIRWTELDENGKPYTFKRNKVKSSPIHRLVAIAWVPNPNPKKFNQVMHINDDPTNYLRENLKWGNDKMNAKGKKKHTDSKEQRYLDLVNKGVIKG